MAAAVAYATSSDPHHPPSAVLDGSPATFWSTTGLFPQELALTWPSERPISKVVIKSCDVRKVVLERATAQQPDKYERIADAEFRNGNGDPQAETIEVNVDNTKSLRIVIQSAWNGDFAAIYSVSVA